MNENEYISSLKARDIRPTALRVLILRTMAGFDRAFSLADLEEELDTVDKSTLFRTLTLFLAHHLVHGIDDGTGSLKYALCSSDCDCEIDDLHTHFYCTHCRRTFACEGWLFRRWVCRTDFRPKRSILLSRDLRRLFGAELTGWIEAACLNDETPSAPVGNGRLKVREFPEAPFPQRMSAGGEPVADQRRAAIRNAGFGVELHAVYRQIPMIKGHDVSRFIVRTCDQLFGHRVRIDDPRMVASYDQGRSDFLQQQIARIGYGQRRRMSVQRGRQLSQFGSERPGERLMSQTDPQHGDSLPHDLSDRRHKVAGLFRDSGTRG